MGGGSDVGYTNRSMVVAPGLILILLVHVKVRVRKDAKCYSVSVIKIREFVYCGLGEDLCRKLIKIVNRPMRKLICPKCKHQWISDIGIPRICTLRELEEGIEKIEIQKQIEIQQLQAKIGKLEGEMEPPCT